MPPRRDARDCAVALGISVFALWRLGLADGVPFDLLTLCRRRHLLVPHAEGQRHGNHGGAYVLVSPRHRPGHALQPSVAMLGVGVLIRAALDPSPRPQHPSGLGPGGEAELVLEPPVGLCAGDRHRPRPHRAHASDPQGSDLEGQAAAWQPHPLQLPGNLTHFNRRRCPGSSRSTWYRPVDTPATELIITIV